MQKPKQKRIRISANTQLYDLNGKECAVSSGDAVMRDLGPDGIFHVFQDATGLIMKVLRVDLPPQPEPQNPAARGMLNEVLGDRGLLEPEPWVYGDAEPPPPKPDTSALHPIGALVTELVHGRDPKRAAELADQFGQTDFARQRREGIDRAARERAETMEAQRQAREAAEKTMEARRQVRKADPDRSGGLAATIATDILKGR